MQKHMAWETGAPEMAAPRHHPSAISGPAVARADERAEASQKSHLAALESLAWITGGLAHDLNNLLTTVLGNISMAMLDLPDATAPSSMLREAAHAVTAASKVTRQLQEFTRHQPTNRQSVCISALIDELSTTLEQMAGPVIAIRTLHAVDAGMVCVDPRQFEMVLLNLARNAIDAMPDGGMLVLETSRVILAQERVTNGMVLTPGAYVAMRVIDQGSGMEPQVLERLFVPFFTTKPRGRGSGLGLAAVRAALRNAGGGIEISSAPGVGTTVIVYYPCLREPKAMLPMAPTPASAPKSRDPSSQATILLVEDEDALRQLGAKILERLGYQVLCASSGHEALALVDRTERGVDLLFTDIIMPGMNGRELAERLCQRFPALKVLYTSGYTERVFACDARDNKPDKEAVLLTKPYTPDALATRIRCLLGDVQAHRPANEPCR